METDNDNRNVIIATAGGHVETLSAAEMEIAQKTGVAGVDLAEHKARVARGDFKPGRLRPLSVILLG